MILHHNHPSQKGINQRGRANLSRLRLPALPEEEGGMGLGADEGSAPHPAAAAGEEEDETAGFRG